MKICFSISYKTFYSLPHKKLKLNFLGYYYHHLCLAKKMLEDFIIFRIMGLLQQAWRCTEQGHRYIHVELYMFGEAEKWEMNARPIDISMVSAVWEYP